MAGLIFGLIFWVTIPPDHAIYLSLIEIEEGEDDTSVLVKVFTDDLQNAILNFSEDAKYEGDSSYCDVNRQLIQDYFNQHLRLKVETEEEYLDFQKSEIKGDSYRIYFTIPKTGWEEIEITADYFMELYPTQQNITIVTNGDLKRSCRLTLKESSCLVEF